MCGEKSRPMPVATAAPPTQSYHSKQILRYCLSERRGKGDRQTVCGKWSDTPCQSKITARTRLQKPILVCVHLKLFADVVALHISTSQLVFQCRGPAEKGTALWQFFMEGVFKFYFYALRRNCNFDTFCLLRLRWGACGCKRCRARLHDPVPVTIAVPSTYLGNLIYTIDKDQPRRLQ